MLVRGADGRLYRVSTEGAVVVSNETQSATQVRVAARRPDDAGAAAEYYGASAEYYTASI